MEKEMQIIGMKEVESRIIEVRGQKVLLDADVAALYGVETKRINEAVRRNPEKFPNDFCFQLQVSETQDVVAICDRFKPLLKSSVEPKAFTEEGLYMMATVLKSPRATATTIAIIRTFKKLRDLTRNLSDVSEELDIEKKKRLLQHTGELLSDILTGDTETTETESSVELNLMAVKFKHVVKKTRSVKPKENR
ncbi:ORF6N domain-containing protein [uncultured Bacteroides sp.]|uniref:ORF6N domain-containing protein n=1 Tax=uncultured Bacteroides sp. TaxID=162156 RepID=UPI0026302063|nr:ORF6N domain-containing protein [uncultured Bacteroides sp.]